MKTIAFLILTLTIGANLVLAQGRPRDVDYEKIRAEKVAFITQYVELTPAEAQKFWPVYNEYEEKKWKLIQENHKLSGSMRNDLEDMSDKEYTELSRKLSSIKLKEGELSAEYNEKFLKLLPPKKVVELYKSEFEFRGQMLRKYRDHRGEKPRRHEE